jgi:hypothetical protein
MYDTIEFEVKDSRIAKVRQPKRRIYMPIKRAAVFGDKRRKRVRTRQAELVHVLRENE